MKNERKFYLTEGIYEKYNVNSNLVVKDCPSPPKFWRKAIKSLLS